MRRAIAIALSLIAALTTLSVLGSAATAQDENASVTRTAQIAAVDDSSGNGAQAVVFGVNTDTGASDVSVEFSGETGTITGLEAASEAGWPIELVFVVDVNNRRVSDGTLGDVKLAVAEIAEDMPAGTSISLVTAGSTAQTQIAFSTNRERIVREARELQPESGAAIFDAVGLAGRLFGQEPGVVRSVVLFAGGPDSGSELSASAASARLIQSGSQLVTVKTENADVSSITESVGGAEVTISDEVSVSSAMDSAYAVASDRLLVSFAATNETGERQNTTFTIAGQEATVSYPPGLNTSNRLQLSAQPEESRLNLNFFGSTFMLYVFIGLAFVGISLGIWSVGSMFAGQSNLDTMLARYDNGPESLEDSEVNEMLVQSALVQRAVDMTESFADKQGFLSRMERLLERANLPVRAGEALFFAGFVSFLVFVVVWFVGGSFLFGVLFALMALGVSYAVVQLLARRRLKKFEGQLPDALQLLAGTLRAGYSLPQGLESVSQEIADPMGEELRRAMTEAQLGRELEPALTGVAERLDSPDFAWAVMAIGIQREVGGNLSELLMTVSETMIQRERLRREVNALTAEGRMSAMILSLLPPGLALVMFVMNPDYIGTLFESTIGWAMVGLAVVLGLVGLAWMKKVITIDA